MARFVPAFLPFSMRSHPDIAQRPVASAVGLSRWPAQRSVGRLSSDRHSRPPLAAADLDYLAPARGGDADRWHRGSAEAHGKLPHLPKGTIRLRRKWLRSSLCGRDPTEQRQCIPHDHSRCLGLQRVVPGSISSVRGATWRPTACTVEPADCPAANGRVATGFARALRSCGASRCVLKCEAPVHGVSSLFRCRPRPPVDTAPTMACPPLTVTC